MDGLFVIRPIQNVVFVVVVLMLVIAVGRQRFVEIVTLQMDSHTRQLAIFYRRAHVGNRNGPTTK